MGRFTVSGVYHRKQNTWYIQLVFNFKLNFLLFLMISNHIHNFLFSNLTLIALHSWRHCIYRGKQVQIVGKVNNIDNIQKRTARIVDL